VDDIHLEAAAKNRSSQKPPALASLLLRLVQSELGEGNDPAVGIAGIHADGLDFAL
jgi:hypothetical protein